MALPSSGGLRENPATVRRRHFNDALQPGEERSTLSEFPETLVSGAETKLKFEMKRWRAKNRLEKATCPVPGVCTLPEWAVKRGFRV